MIQSSVTISLVDAARGGPFVLWEGLEAGCKTAKELGFDAIEVFSLGPEQIDCDELEKLLADYELELAAFGTGAGMVKHGLSLTALESSDREKAKDFIRRIIDMGGRFSAAAILGSMQGRWGADLNHADALELLGEACAELGAYARQYNVPFIYEHLNRYESNLCNTVAANVEFLDTLGEDSNVVILADLFHMNIEETCVADGIRDGKGRIGHIHFVDSNRCPAGLGHMDFDAITTAIKEIGYEGYLSAEALPYPTEYEAAKKTMETYNKYFG